MSLIYQAVKKNSFEYKTLKKFKKILENKLHKNQINVSENILIGFSYGDYEGVNVFYETKKSESTARFLKGILENNHITIRCFSHLEMEYDIEILIGRVHNKKGKKHAKANANVIIDSFFKTFSILENGMHISS